MPGTESFDIGCVSQGPLALAHLGPASLMVDDAFIDGENAPDLVLRRHQARARMTLSTGTAMSHLIPLLDFGPARAVRHSC